MRYRHYSLSATLAKIRQKFGDPTANIHEYSWSWFFAGALLRVVRVVHKSKSEEEASQCSVSFKLTAKAQWMYAGERGKTLNDIIQRFFDAVVVPLMVVENAPIFTVQLKLLDSKAVPHIFCEETGCCLTIPKTHMDLAWQVVYGAMHPELFLDAIL